MKIQLQLSNDTLIACNQLLQSVYNESTVLNVPGKVVKSICFDVADKIDSKCRTIIKKTSLFDQKKKHKLTLKYHEAWGLYEALRTLNAEVNNNEYKQSLVQNVINTIHQKLT